MNPIEFARNLFTLRMERKWTVERLAAELEVTPELVCEWECAKTSPSLDQMNRLAKIYGIPLDEIIRNPKPREEIPAPEPISQEPEAPAPEETAAEEPAAPVEEPKKKYRSPKVSDLIVIILLLIVIFGALLLLVRPDLFPFGAWIAPRIAPLFGFSLH